MSSLFNKAVSTGLFSGRLNDEYVCPLEAG